MSNLLRDSMPQLLLDANKVIETFHDLEVTATNEAIYHALVGHVHVQDIASKLGVALTPGYRLICITTRISNEKFEIALVNDHIKQVVYYNQVIIVHYKDLKCRPATQQRVWRSADFQHKPVLRDLPAKVFFDYILARYDVILSDNIQTGEGMHFWKERMSEALYRQLYVYHYDVMTADLNQILTQQQLNALSDTIWGKVEGHHEWQLAIIACKPLPYPVEITI